MAASKCRCSRSGVEGRSPLVRLPRGIAMGAIVAGGLLLSMLACGKGMAAQASRPNVIVILADAAAGMEAVTDLSYENVARYDALAAEALYPAALAIGIAAVAARALTFLMCHPQAPYKL